MRKCPVAADVDVFWPLGWNKGFISCGVYIVWRSKCSVEAPWSRKTRVGFGVFSPGRTCHSWRVSAAGKDSVEQPRMRKIIEHVVLLQMKSSMSEEQEKDMLDNLYTLQYYFRGIVCVSLGRLISENQKQCTHGVFMRFSSKQLLEQYNEHPTHLKIFKEFVAPYCHGFIVADFESEVIDDLEPVFRRGEDFESGIEHIVFLKIKPSTPEPAIREMLSSLQHLTRVASPYLIQLTAGANFSSQGQGYTHAILARLPSEEALESFNKHEAYACVFSSKIFPLCTHILTTDYRVEPIGTTVQP